MGAHAASAAAPAFPFKASVSGNISPTGVGTFALAGTGNASHLGNVSYKANAKIIRTDPVTGVITDTLTETLTAANGDTLTILCQQVATRSARACTTGSIDGP